MTELTNELRSRIFNQYIGARVVTGEGEEYTLRGCRYHFDGGDLIFYSLCDGDGRKTNEANYFGNLPIQLILKPIEDITEKDIAALWCELQFNEDYKDRDPEFPGMPTKKEFLLSKVAKDDNYNLSLKEALVFVDFCRSKGYMLPYMGIDLFESGIAVKK